MSRFEQVRALVEDSIRENLGDEDCACAPIDMMASSLMAKCYGMVLHDKVNDATAQAISGKIFRDKSFSTYCASVLLRGTLVNKHPELQAVREELIKNVVEGVCKGEVSEKAREAFKNSATGSVQFNLIAAYRRAIHDDGSAPTITEVRIEFLEENKKTRLPKGYTLRKKIDLRAETTICGGHSINIKSTASRVSSGAKRVCSTGLVLPRLFECVKSLLGCCGLI